MADQKGYVKLWLSYKSYFESYSAAEVGRLVLAMIDYRETGATPEFSGSERFIWPAIRRDIDESMKAQEKQTESNRENGKRGGRPRKANETEEKQKNPFVFSESEKSQGQGKGKGQGKGQGEGEGDYNPLSPSAIVRADYINRINPTPSSSSLDTLGYYAEQMGVDVCKRAFDIALDNKKTSWSYIRAILADKLSKGVKCLADWDELDKKHEQEKKTQTRGNKNPNSMVGMDLQPSAERIRKNAESLDKLLAETRSDFDGR